MQIHMTIQTRISEHVSMCVCMYVHEISTLVLSSRLTTHSMSTAPSRPGRDYASGQTCTPSESRLHKTPLLLHLPVSPSRASPIQVLIPSLRYMQVSSHPSSVSLTGLFRPPCYFRSSGVDPVLSQGLHPHPSHCLGPQPTAMQLPPGPTRSSAPDSRDLTLHLYLRLTCRPCRQATFSPTDGRATVPTVTASQPVWRHKCL